MKNLIQKDDRAITVAAPAGGVSSGDFVVVGGIYGFAVSDAAAGDDVALVRRGVFRVAKASAEVVSQGDDLEYASGSAEFTAHSAGVKVAVAAADAGAGSTALTVLLV